MVFIMWLDILLCICRWVLLLLLFRVMLLVCILMLFSWVIICMWLLVCIILCLFSVEGVSMLLGLSGWVSVWLLS